MCSCLNKKSLPSLVVYSEGVVKVEEQHVEKLERRAEGLRNEADVAMHIAKEKENAAMDAAKALYCLGKVSDCLTPLEVFS